MEERRVINFSRCQSFIRFPVKEPYFLSSGLKGEVLKAAEKVEGISFFIMKSLLLASLISILEKLHFFFESCSITFESSQVHVGNMSADRKNGLCRANFPNSTIYLKKRSVLIVSLTS